MFMLFLIYPAIHIDSNYIVSSIQGINLSQFTNRHLVVLYKMR